MDLLFWGSLLFCSCASFIIGLGIGGLLTVRRIDRHNARFLSDEEQELGI